MDFYSSNTLSAETEYYMQLGSKKNFLKASEINFITENI